MLVKGDMCAKATRIAQRASRSMLTTANAKSDVLMNMSVNTMTKNAVAERSNSPLAILDRIRLVVLAE